MPPAHAKVPPKKSFSFHWTLILLIIAELFFLFIALSIGSIAGKGILIIIGVVLVILNAGRLTKR